MVEIRNWKLLLISWKTLFVYISKEILQYLLAVGLSKDRSLLLTVPNPLAELKSRQSLRDSERDLNSELLELVDVSPPPSNVWL